MKVTGLTVPKLLLWTAVYAGAEDDFEQAHHNSSFLIPMKPDDNIYAISFFNMLDLS